MQKQNGDCSRGETIFYVLEIVSVKLDSFVDEMEITTQ
jgi:hypothetical protein